MEVGGRIAWTDAGTECSRPIGGPRPLLSSGDLWKGIRLEQVELEPGERPEGYLAGHLVSLYVGSPLVLEGGWPGAPRRTWRVMPGSVHILPAEVPHSARWRGAVEAIKVELAPEFVAAIAAGIGVDEQVQLHPAFCLQDPLITHLVLALREELRAGNPGGRTYAETLGTALAAHLLRMQAAPDAWFEGGSGGLPTSSLRRVLQYIDDHLESDLALQNLAGVARMGVYSFIRRFKKSTGLPPHQYVLRRRVERARSLLGDPALPIAEVALRSGFGDQSSFTTAFRRLTSLTPRAYRNAIL